MKMVDFKFEKEPFRVSRDQEERDTDKGKIFTIRLNAMETTQLKQDMKILRQVKPSTALKQLALIGSFVLHSDKIGRLLGFILGNIRRNEQTGITDTDTEIEANVTQK